MVGTLSFITLSSHSPMMDMHSRNQYLQTLLTAKGYHLKTKTEKSMVLDEYCHTTGQNRKYVIRKIRSGGYAEDRTRVRRRHRASYYDGEVTAALVTCWEIFDYPCGQRLEPLLKDEVSRLRQQHELVCSDTVAAKLKAISFRTIDEKLKHEKEVKHLQQKYRERQNPLLYQKIPVKTASEQDRGSFGNIQIDCVEHCGNSASGEYVSTLSTTDIAIGWWEGEAVMGRGQKAAADGLQQARTRYPFPWREIHSDNGSEFINAHLYRYTEKEGLGFSRSRPYKKNDNCLVEQKNWTHVKKFVGYSRYDTGTEQRILNDLYRNELRLYKNFFQSVIKLVSKERIGGKIRRKYDTPKTPYKRVMGSPDVPEQTKQELARIYESLNPAELKRTIDRKLNLLSQIYQAKQGHEQKVEWKKKLTPRMAASFIAQPEAILVT